MVIICPHIISSVICILYSAQFKGLSYRMFTNRFAQMFLVGCKFVPSVHWNLQKMHYIKLLVIVTVVVPAAAAVIPYINLKMLITIFL